MNGPDAKKMYPPLTLPTVVYCGLRTWSCSTLRLIPCIIRSPFSPFVNSLREARNRDLSPSEAQIGPFWNGFQAKEKPPADGSDEKTTELVLKSFEIPDL